MSNQDQNLAMLPVIFNIFKTQGLKKNSMDNIAKQLGISKKTLYKIANNKDDLVAQTMQWHIDTEHKKIKEINKITTHAIDRFMLVSQWILQQAEGVSPIVLLELKQYHKAAWELMQKNIHQFILNYIIQNIKQGIQQGLYKKDLKPKFIAYYYVSIIDHLSNINQFITHAKMPHAVREMHKYHLSALLSNKGIEYIKQKKEYAWLIS